MKLRPASQLATGAETQFQASPLGTSSKGSKEIRKWSDETHVSHSGLQDAELGFSLQSFFLLDCKKKNETKQKLTCRN